MFTLCFVNTKIFKMYISKYYYWFHSQECLLGIANEILSVLSIQFSSSVMYDSLQPHGLQHARPPCPSPTPGVYSNSCPLGQRMSANHLILCRALLLQPSIFPSIRDQIAKSLQLCPTLCDPIDGSPPGFPVPGILQARTLEWVAISFSNA